MKRVLITGFEKFDNATANPTQDMLVGLDYSQALVKTAVLPVEFERSFTQLQQLITEFAPDYVLLCGLAGNRQHISIEKIGINYINARIADNAGNQPLDSIISQHGDDGYFSTFEVTGLMHYMHSTNFDLKVSFSAGSYVCNYLLYKALEFLKGSQTKCTFFHFPPSCSDQSVADYQAFLLEVLNFISEQPSLNSQKQQEIAQSFGCED